MLDMSLTIAIVMSSANWLLTSCMNFRIWKKNFNYQGMRYTGKRLLETSRNSVKYEMNWERSLSEKIRLFSILKLIANWQFAQVIFKN